jgi:uncharacterized protein (TIGR01370 family)
MLKKTHRQRQLMQSFALFFMLIILGAPSYTSEGITPTVTVTPTPSPREQIKMIRNYMIYYGRGRADELAHYHLAIVQPETLIASELAQLRAHGTLVVAYLSIGEAEPSRPWFQDGRVDQKWLLGLNRNWGSYFVDARQPGWQRLMRTLMGDYLARGFDGVFLDTVDTAEAFPETRQGMIDLIHALRQAYPDALLVQNRGFNLIADVATSIDAVMFEGVSTTYNFTTKTYGVADNASTARKLEALGKTTGLPILALDYVPPDQPKTAAWAMNVATGYGFIPAVSVIQLDDIPDYGPGVG